MCIVVLLVYVVLLCLCIISNAQQQLDSINQYNISRDADGTYRWVSLTDFIPQPATAYGSIPIGEVMRMEFDFTFGGRSNTPVAGDWEMFFRVGFSASGGPNCGGQGARYPSLWLTDTRDTLHVSVSEGTTCQPQQSLSDYGNLAVGASYHIIIAFNQSELTVQIDGPTRSGYIKPWRRAPTHAQYLGQWAPVWFMSDKTEGAYNAGSGTFSNIVLTSFTSTESTPSPSNAPSAYQPPTVSPTKTPTAPTVAPLTVAPSMATLLPSQTPTSTPTVIPTRSPTLLPTKMPTIRPTKTPTLIPSALPTNLPSIQPTTQSPETARPTLAPLKPTKQPLQWGDILTSTTTTTTTEYVYDLYETQSTKDVEAGGVVQEENSQQVELIIFGTVIGVCVCTVVVFLTYLKYKKKLSEYRNGAKTVAPDDSPNYQLSLHHEQQSVQSVQKHMGMHNVYSSSARMTNSLSKSPQQQQQLGTRKAGDIEEEEDETKPLTSTHVLVHSKSITITAPAHQYNNSNTSIGIHSGGSQPNASYLLSPQTAAAAQAKSTVANINDLVCDLEKFQSDSINISVMKVSNEDPPTPAVSPNVLRASATSPNAARNSLDAVSGSSGNGKRTLPLVDKVSSSKPRNKTKGKKSKSKGKGKGKGKSKKNAAPYQHEKMLTDETLDAFVPESRPDSPALPLSHSHQRKQPKSARKSKKNEMRRTPRKQNDRIKSYDSNSNNDDDEEEEESESQEDDEEDDREHDHDHEEEEDEEDDFEEEDDDDVKYDGCGKKKKKKTRMKLKLTESPSFGKQKLRKPPKARGMSNKISKKNKNKSKSKKNSSKRNKQSSSSYQAVTVLPPPPYHKPRSTTAYTAVTAVTAVDEQETYEEQSHSVTDSEEAYRHENANDGYGAGDGRYNAGDGDGIYTEYEHAKLNYKGMHMHMDVQQQQQHGVDMAHMAHMGSGGGGAAATMVGVTVAEGGGYEGDGLLAYTHYDGANMDQMANAYGYGYGGYNAPHNAYRAPVQHVQQQQQQYNVQHALHEHHTNQPMYHLSGASPLYDTNDVRVQAKGKKVGYDWIKKTLQRVDSRYHADYFRNFRKHRVKDDCLGDLLPDDWKELIPAIGPRNAFKRLWRLKFGADGGGYEVQHGGVTGEFDYDDDDDTNTDRQSLMTDDVHSELLSEPGTVFSGNTSHTGFAQLGVADDDDDDDEDKQDDDDEYAESELTEQTQDTQEFVQDRKYESQQSLRKPSPHKMDKHVSRPSNIDDYVHHHEEDENASFQSHDDHVDSDIDYDDATETTGLTGSAAAQADDYYERRRRQPQASSFATSSTSNNGIPPGAVHTSSRSPKKAKTPGKYLDDPNDIENDANSFLSNVMSDDSGQHQQQHQHHNRHRKSDNNSIYSQSTYEEPPSTLDGSVPRKPSDRKASSSSTASGTSSAHSRKSRKKEKYQKQKRMNMPAPIEEVDNEQDTDDMDAGPEEPMEQQQQQQQLNSKIHGGDSMRFPHAEYDALTETTSGNTFTSTEPMGSLEEENGHIADDECKTDAGTSLYSYSPSQDPMELLVVAEPTPNMISPPIPPQFVGNHALAHIANSKTLPKMKNSRSSYSSRSGSVSSHVSSWNGSEAPEPEVKVNPEDLKKPLDDDVEEYSDEDMLGIPKFDAEVDASDDEDDHAHDSSSEEEDDDDDNDEEEEEDGEDDEFEEDEESSSDNGSSKNQTVTNETRTDEEELDEEEYEDEEESDDEVESVSQGLSQSQEESEQLSEHER